MKTEIDDKSISDDNMKSLAAALIDGGYLLVTESADGNGFSTLMNGAGLSFRSDLKPTSLSFKEFIFPKTEPLFHFRRSTDNVELFETPLAPPPVVIFGARPCDAKSVGILSKLFNWDYKDQYFNSKADNLTVVGMLCRHADDRCFCTSVGISPSSTDGSDLFLIPMDDGSWTVKTVTEKGARLLQPFENLFSPAMHDAGEVIERYPGPGKKFDAAAVRSWIRDNFSHPFWSSLADTCLGCAQCAFVCPVCHCFDIVDEADTYFEGRRMKNWDACQHGMFTKHASGHNPRDTQARRYRQRVSHKFSYYPERFGEMLCTGCGRCARGCAVGMDICEAAAAIAGISEQTPANIGQAV